MLISSQRFENIPVMSLQTGGRLARAKKALIDPRNLSIIAYELDGSSLSEHPSFLRIADVRELSNLGLIVDSSDEFVGLDDVIKVKEVYDLHFELIGKLVRDEKKHRLGKVISYAVEPGSFLIKQIAVKRPILKSFNDTELLIDRTQIVEVSDEAIIVKHDEREPAPVKKAVNTYTNPFRQASSRPQAEAIDTDHS